jgi:large subunit ribosomal protein L13
LIEKHYILRKRRKKKNQFFKMTTKRMQLASALARQPAWHVIDASRHIVGRLASQIARVIQGKHKPLYDPSVDNGDYVVVVNAEKVQFCVEKKWQHKLYRWHTGYPGGLKEVAAGRMLEKHPTRILERAVKGMLPKNRLLQSRMKKLRLFVGEEHDHQAQVDSDVNRAMIDALGVEWDQARPRVDDVFATEQFRPGYIVALEQEGDFLTGYAAPLEEPPKTKAARRAWVPRDEVQEFLDALEHRRRANKDDSPDASSSRVIEQ